MAHNLEQRDGQASMFFTGDVPWHQLGRHLNKPATAAEAMEAARLDYTVVKRPMKAIINGHKYSDVPNAFATVRTDTNQVLGVVGARYEPVQNRDAFNFFDPLVDRDEAVYHTQPGFLDVVKRFGCLQNFLTISKSERKMIRLKNSFFFTILTMVALISE